MKTEITALYDAYVARHPEGATTTEIRQYLIAQMRTRLAGRPRDLDTEATNLISAHLPKVRETRKDLTRANFLRIVDHLTGGDTDLDVQAISMIALPTGDPTGVDKTLMFWGSDDIDTWVQARRQHTEDAVRSYALDVDTAGQVRALMHQKGAYTLGDLLLQDGDDQ